MNKLMNDLSFKRVQCYLDDILIFSETLNEHICDLQEVFDRLQKAGLKFSPQKCKFVLRKCIFLGHEISKEGLKPPSDRSKSISEYQVPKNAKALKRFVGLMNWFKKYIPQ